MNMERRVTSRCPLPMPVPDAGSAAGSAAPPWRSATDIMKNKGILTHIGCFSILIPAILLAGCAMTPEPSRQGGEDTDSAWRARNNRLDGIREWSATGRIAIDMENEAWNASVHWRQQRDDYRIRFNAPLVSGSVEIAGGPDRVTLRTTDHRRVSATDPESLLSGVMGWHIPISGLRYWILGRPEAGAPIDRLKVDPQGRPRRLDQSEWRIRYPAYRHVDGLELPALLILENPRLSARIRIGAWMLGPYESGGAIHHDTDPGGGLDRDTGIRAVSMDTSLSVPGAERTASKCERGGWMRSIPLVGAMLKRLLCE